MVLLLGRSWGFLGPHWRAHNGGNQAVHIPFLFPAHIHLLTLSHVHKPFYFLLTARVRGDLGLSQCWTPGSDPEQGKEGVHRVSTQHDDAHCFAFPVLFWSLIAPLMSDTFTFCPGPWLSDSLADCLHLYLSIWIVCLSPLLCQFVLSGQVLCFVSAFQPSIVRKTAEGLVC